LKGSPKGGPFFVVCDLGKLWEYFGQTATANAISLSRPIESGQGR